MSSDNNSNELTYHLPPDILHYEPKYYFGLSLQEMMAAVLPSMGVMFIFGPVLGAITAIGMILGLRRWENFGNRSVLVYLGLFVWYRYRPGEISIPRVLPLHPSRVEVANWEGQTLFVLEGDEQ